MLTTYLGDDSDGLDGFEFLTMAEAGEVGHWAVLRQAERARRRGTQSTSSSSWALPIQERHFDDGQGVRG